MLLEGIDSYENSQNYVQEQIARLQSVGYTVNFSYDGDGFSEDNKLYTVTAVVNEQTVTYARLVRGRELGRIPAPGDLNTGSWLGC